MIKTTVLFLITLLCVMGDRLNAEDRDIFLCENIKPHGQIKKLNSLETGYEAPLDKSPHSVYFDTAVSSVYDYAKKDNGNRDKFFLDGQRDDQVIVFHQIEKDGTI